MSERLLKFWRDWRGLLLFFVIMIVFRSAVADWNQVPSGSMQPGILGGDRIVVDKLAWDLRVPFTDIRLMRWSNPERGEIVTFDNPVDGRLFIKRVVAVPGDRVEWRRDQLLINGERATYTPLAESDLFGLMMEKPRNHRFYREQLMGGSRVVMFRGRPGTGEWTDSPLRLFSPVKEGCAGCELRASTAGSALSKAICRCCNHGACSSFPPFTVPEDKYWMMGDNRDNSTDSRFIGFVDRRHIYGRAHAVAFSVGDNYWPRFRRFFTDLTN